MGIEDGEVRLLRPAEHSGVIGVSLDSQLFTRPWVRFALQYTLSKHKDVELFLGDRLLLYNKTVEDAIINPSVNFESARARAELRRSEITAFLRSEIGRLPTEDQTRVKITSWSDYADGAMEDILRDLQISYVAVAAFKERVDQDVALHFSASPEVTRPRTHKELSRLYVIEETAMIIRIAEIACKPFFYYPEDEPATIRALYRGEFRAFGLSVENLARGSNTRIFTPLVLPEADTAEVQA